MPEYITSRSNPLIVETAKLFDKKYRDDLGEFLLEGRKLFLEAVSCRLSLTYVFVTEAYYEQYRKELSDFNLRILSPAVFDKISSENAPQGILCRAKYIDFLHNFTTIYNTGEKKESLFALYEVRDPGNLGTAIRTANALGIDTLLLSGCADIYHPRTVRAAMGGLFRQKIVICRDLAATLQTLRTNGYRTMAAALDRHAMELQNVDGHAPLCFVVGNEGHGLPSAVIDACTETVFIPISPCAESLNASVAAAILMWHCRTVSDSE